MYAEIIDLLVEDENKKVVGELEVVDESGDDENKSFVLTATFVVMFPVCGLLSVNMSLLMTKCCMDTQ
jgi:hypothetical protein